MAPKETHSIPGSVAIKNFAGGNKAKVLGVGSPDCPISYTVFREILQALSDMATQGQERYNMAGFKDRARGPKPRNAEASGKGKIKCDSTETLRAE